MKELELEEIVAKIGLKIKSLRTEQNMTQEELAIKSDIDVRSIQRLENGHTSASLKTLVKISRALKINLSSLFNFSEGNEKG